MPDRMAENLILYVRKNNGRLGRKWRENEFAKLTDAEVTSREEIVREACDGYGDPAINKAADHAG
jgi:hypothetical protein